MNRIFTLIVFFLIGFSNLYSQKSSSEDLIPINSKFILEIESLNDKEFSYTVIEVEKYNGNIDISNSSNILDSVAVDNQIHGIFSYGTFGEKKQVVLLLKSGLSKSIDYDLFIEVPSKRKLQKTSVVSLHHNTNIIEFWPYHIDKIKFAAFRLVPELDYSILDFMQLDSTCLKDNGESKLRAENVIKQHFDTVVNQFLLEKGFKIDKASEIERLNDSELTLECRSSIGVSIYPHRDKYNMRIKEFTNIECPYIELKTTYYYTKWKKSVKLTFYEWNDFESWNGEYKTGLNWEIGEVIFRNKFESISSKMTSILGQPILTEWGSKEDPTNYRDGVKWKSEHGICAYLFMFGGEGRDFNQIRLAIYKDE